MISFMGYNEEQLIKVIEFWECEKGYKAKKMKVKEEAKLTRIEAIDLYKSHYPYPFTNTSDAAKVIDFFIAAGMLEVKEEEKVTQRSPYVVVNSTDNHKFVVSVNHLIDTLKLAGFEIKPNSVWGNAEIKIKEEEEKPIFEIINRDCGRHIKVYANGRIEGITGTVINRIPEVITKLKQNNS